LLEHSVNLYAESLLVALSEGSGPVSARTGSVGLRRALNELGVDPAGWSAVDGSGLSRHDLASARTLTAALSAGLRAPFGAVLRDALPLAGRTGTLAARMKGTPLEGRVRAKTGSMTGVRALAGELTPARGEPLVFAFLVNGITAEPRAVDDAIERALALVANSAR
jgi:D-alanyl-D-alanine carboxypeptidase/D-alanyl-D-alanine-endopeptidase (penicillin-binding protein 4)